MILIRFFTNGPMMKSKQNLFNLLIWVNCVGVFIKLSRVLMTLVDVLGLAVGFNHNVKHYQI